MGSKKRELTTLQSEILMASVILARSTSFVISKISLGTMPPFNILAVRFLLAFIILAAIFFKRLREIDKAALRSGIILGVILNAVLAFELHGMQTAESSMSSLIENSAFMLVPVFMIIFQRTFPSKKNVLGMALAFCGIIILNFGPGAEFNIGYIYYLAAMFFYAILIFVTSIVSKNADPLLIGIVQVGTMFIVSFAEALIYEDFRMPADGKEWGMVLALAIVCTAFGFTLQPVAQRGLSADRAGMFSVLSPLGAVLWGYIILAEPLTPLKLVGGSLILIGIALPSVKHKHLPPNNQL